MRIAVVGATGRTGAKVVELLLAEGHSVRALTRSPSWEGDAPPAADPRLQWVEGDVLDPSSIARLASGAEAFVVALGPSADSPPDLCSRGTTAVISACRAFRIKRLVVVTGAMIGHPRELLAVVLRSISGMYGLFRSSTLADRRRQEEIVMASGLDWTLVRPPRLVDGDRTGQLLAGSELFVHATAYATVGDVARVIVDALAEGRWLKGGVVVVSGVAPEATASAPGAEPADEASQAEAAAVAPPHALPVDPGTVRVNPGSEPVDPAPEEAAAPRGLPTHEDLPPLTQTPVTASEAVPAPAPTPTPAPQAPATPMSATVEWEDDEDWFDPAAPRDPWPQRDQAARDLDDIDAHDPHDPHDRDAHQPALVSDPGAGGRDEDDPDR